MTKAGINSHCVSLSFLHLTLFFTYGVSLKTWAENGLLQREVVLYKKLIEKHGLSIQFVTFGGASDRQYEKLLGDISILPVYEKINRSKSRIIRFIKSLFIPWVYRNDFKKTDIIKTNQQWGSWLGVII